MAKKIKVFETFVATHKALLGLVRTVCAITILSIQLLTL